jgi:hypothetical protein
VRLATPHGVVHVWTPDDYDAATAGVVFYLHGYYTTVDRAWSEHRLEEQFAASRVNAMFIACATPDRPRRAVAWPRLGTLVDYVRVHLPEGDVPLGPRIAVAHSGGHRTLTNWIRFSNLDGVVLLDALYDEVPEYLRWIRAGKSRRLIDVASLTQSSAELLHRRVKSVVVDGIGESLPDARIVYVRTDIDHMEMVTGGQVLPVVLRALGLPKVSREREHEGEMAVLEDVQESADRKRSLGLE